jgi:4-amino-4-deoxy-L-arabinose transferase-like glycosyltransferase
MKLALRNMFNGSRSRERGLDAGIFVLLVVGYATALLCTMRDLGYARDEGFYFQAADSYLKWFQLLTSEPLEALKQNNVDRYWAVNHEHPALIKSLFALSRHCFYDTLGWFSEPGTSYRFVGVLFGSFAVGTLYLWGKEALSRTAGLVAALSFAFIPRIFYHCHLDCFDMPVLAMWLFTAYAYWRSLEQPSLWRSLLCGVLYGLLLNTKHNSWLLPFALVAHLWLARGSSVLHAWSQRKLGIPHALFAMALLGPPVFYLMWPWIWFDTADRFVEYVKFHTAHVYYNMEFLGQTYFKPPFPRSYAWLMSLATVPFVLWILALTGLLGFARWTLRDRLRPWLQQLRAEGRKGLFTAAPLSAALSTKHNALVLWGLCILASYAPWLSNSSPIFGGTKHWMVAYPFLCLFAGLGFDFVVCRARAQLGQLKPLRALMARAWPLPLLLAVTVLLGPLLMTAHSHPYALSTYLPIVGGAPGGATLGLNRSFWGYTTGVLQDVINENAEKRGRIFVHDTALQSWAMLEQDGRVRKDLKPQLDVTGSDLAIYHHEQHMARVEYQIWVDYGTVKPLHIGAFDGVPVVWLYKRPR